MNLWAVYLVTILGVDSIKCQDSSCDLKCDVEKHDNLICALDPKPVKYYVFPSKCALERHLTCFGTKLEETSMEFCMKSVETVKRARRMYGESCPVFCPSHYRPVCAATENGYYNYRAFVNGCNLDMVNCRGNYDMPHYIEVPLKHCSRHMMKNIFAEQIIYANAHNSPDYL